MSRLNSAVNGLRLNIELAPQMNASIQKKGFNSALNGGRNDLRRFSRSPIRIGQGFEFFNRLQFTLFDKFLDDLPRLCMDFVRREVIEVSR